MRFLIAAVLFIASMSCALGAERQRIMPPGTKVAGPYSPGILAGEFLYVAGQGAEDAQGQLPKDEEARIRQCLNNVKTVVDATGLTMEHVVYVQVYLTNYLDEQSLNRVWKEFFPKAPPARSTIGVAKLAGTPVEMSAVAIRDLSLKTPIVPPGYPASVPFSPAVRAAGRLYLSGFLGREDNGSIRSGAVGSGSHGADP
jgi:2-iminobutanoate/2-iminopropanoate deaminase